MVQYLSNGATIASPGDAPGDLVALRPRTVEFNGLLLGSGTPYRWKDLTGWDDMPGLDLSDSPRPNSHGDYPGMGLYQARLPSFTLEVHGSDRDQTESLLQLFVERMAYDDAEVPLCVRDSGRTLNAQARVIARSVPHQPQRSVGIAQVAVQWRCASPLRTDPTLLSEVLAAGSATGGLEYPLEYPLEYGTPAPDMSRNLPNPGEAPAPATVRFNGPATSYGVSLASGGMLAFNLPLAAGEYLAVDTLTGTVLLNGSSDRSAWITPDSVPPESWRIPRGGSTASFFANDATPPTTTVEIQWHPTYW